MRTSEDNLDLLVTLVLTFINVFILAFFMVMLLLGIHTFSSQSYETNNIVECNDLDGDIIKGVTCYDKIRCANILKFFNPEGCEEFIK